MMAMRTVLPQSKTTQGNSMIRRSTHARVRSDQDRGPRSEFGRQRIHGNQGRLWWLASGAKDAPIASTGLTQAGDHVPKSLQRKHDSQGGGVDGGVPKIVHEVLQSPGQNLDPDSRVFMEQRLGRDFGDVRIHTGAAAAESAKAINARAFTFGRDIVFGSGAYAPRTLAGQHLLAHELVHVAQQGARNFPPTRISNPHDAQEHEASCMASGIMHGGPVPSVASGGRVGTVFRQQRPPQQGGLQPTAPARIVYVDASVFDQINRGNQQAATALRNMLNSGVDVRITEWTSREMIQRPALPRTATANRILIQDLGIGTDPIVPFERRVELALPNQTRTGTVLSPPDAQVVMGARAGGGELWSFDRAFRNNPQNIRNTFGVTVAAESALPLNPRPPSADYRVGRRLLGLPAVEISVSGVVRGPRGPTGPGSGGGAGPSRSGPGGAGSTGPGRSGPGGAAPSTAPAAPPGPATARVPPPPPPRAVPPAAPALVIERSRLIRTLNRQTHSTVAFSRRLQIYMRVGGSLLSILEWVNAVGDIQNMASHGTTLPQVQQTANLIDHQSRSAEHQAQATFDSISLISATIQVGDAIERRDSTVLFELSESLGDFGLAASEQAFRCGDLARRLRVRARALHVLSDAYAGLVRVPQGMSTAPQASALAMHLSLQRLALTLDRAATHYDTARQRYGYIADFTVGLASRANSTAWRQVFIDIARQLAEMERQSRAASPSAGTSSGGSTTSQDRGQDAGSVQGSGQDAGAGPQ